MRIFDLHSDILSEVKGKKLYKTLKTEVESGLNGLVAAAFSTGKDPFDIFSLANLCHEKKDQFENEGSAFDLRLSYEDLGFVDTSNIHSLLLTQPCMCSLTWNFDNKLAGGANGYLGLSAFGQKVVQILEEENILIDTAHLNEKSFMDVAITSKNPLVCSHTAFWEVNEHPRNLKDYQIRIILESGGVVGLCLVSYFLSNAKRVTINDFVGHILHFANTFGTVDGLCLGTDFFGTKHLPSDLKSYDNFCKVFDRLIGYGFSNEDIDCIFFANAAKLLNK